MKKVIAVLAAIVTLIIGTAVGVAMSASHLSEKELLTAGDVPLALASQGVFTLPAMGDYSELAVDGVTPAVYKANGVKLVVYEFANTGLQENTVISSRWPDAAYRIMPIGAWRNLYIGYLFPLQVDWSSDEQMTPQELAKLDAAFQETFPKVLFLQNSLLNTFCDMQKKTVHINSEQMIYTIEQRSSCIPISVGGQTMYECWLTFRPVSCQYKEHPMAEERSAKLYFEAVHKGSKMTLTHDQLRWDGQGQLDYLVPECGNRFLTERPDSTQYRIIFEHGDLQDEAAVTIDWGE